MKVKNSMNASQFEKNYEKNGLPSMTVPDQTMSIRTILERYSRGLPVGGRTDIYYDEDDTLPDPRTLDLTERQELAEQFVKEIVDTKRKKNVSTNVDNNVDNSEGVIKTDETES
jgi:hypothetical protein